VQLAQSRGGVFFALVMECKIFFSLSSYRISKKHDTKWGRPGVSRGQPGQPQTIFFISYGYGRKAIAYTDLLGAGPLFFS